jgi:anti-anti-sigma factor
MDMERTQTGESVNFSFTGSFSGIDKATVSLFGTILTDIEKKPVEIVFNMEKATFFDSMAVGLLVGILLKCKEKGVAIRIEKISRNLRTILDMTMLKKAFPQLY